MSRAVRTAPIRRSPTTPAAIGTAQNAKVQRPSNGSPNARPTCWRCRIITSCSRCRRRLPTSPTRTRPWSMISCSRLQPRPCSRLRVTPSTWAPASAGAAWRQANAGHVSLGQLKVMSAIESCRTAALGGHVACCEDCAYTTIAYNSCRNRHCPKCQGAAAKQWLAERQADLLAVPYYHIVFTMPAAIADIAYQNKAVVYDLLFKASAETMLTIAGDPKHLGARIGITSVLHTWGSTLTHHPHVHMIVPGGGIALDGSRWVSCRSRFFLPWR